MKYKILVVDDDKELVKMLCSYFNMKQYETITATDGMEALNKMKMKPDIILLDINMPRMDGIEVCRLIRSKVLCPILFLTARVDEDDKINGLLSGGDDYITKPFRIQELRARVAAHLRREKREHHSILSFEPDIRFDLSAKVLYVSEQPVPLTKSEYSICEYLAKNRGQVFTKEQIYEAVFGFDGIGDNSTISTHIKNIRAKLEHFKISPISTVWGIGYKWE